MPRADYEGSMPANYDAGRGLTDESAATWREITTPLLTGSAGHPLLDLGAGTGRFTGLLHDWSGIPVVAVEPAPKMRQELVAKRPPGLVGVLGAAGEALPFADGRIGGVWLSQVVHHFDDLPLAVAELRRVTCPGGHVLVRGAFDRDPNGPPNTESALHGRFFPDAIAYARQRFPSRERLREVFGRAGLPIATEVSVEHVIAPTLEDYAARVRLRADSTLTAIDDHAFERGMAALDAVVKASPPGAPVVETLSLLVLVA
jgi:ubiquinone/menaquinone biosynthesis C-methylase UbiE